MIKNFLSLKSLHKLQKYPLSQALQKEPIQLKISSITNLSHDTKIYHLDLQKDQTLGIKTGEHVQFLSEHNGEPVKRCYTPISPPDQKGTCDILVKLYRKEGDFEGGKMSNYLDTKQVNDELTIAGPVGRLNYLGNGKFLWLKDQEERQFKKLIMVAGGSGITPIYQILQQIDLQKENIQARVIFGNRSPNDILLQKELQELNEQNPNISIDFVVDEGGNAENGFLNGIISNELLKEKFYENDGETLAICCGPLGMNKVVLGTFEELGYRIDSLFKF